MLVIEYHCIPSSLLFLRTLACYPTDWTPVLTSTGATHEEFPGEMSSIAIDNLWIDIGSTVVKEQLYIYVRIYSERSEEIEALLRKRGGIGYAHVTTFLPSATEVLTSRRLLFIPPSTSFPIITATRPR